MPKFLIVSMIVISAFFKASAANWVDDWFDTAVVTKPGVFESQQRSYATFGSFNGRIKTSTDNLMTISSPRISAGCGGIDIFMGGFSFLNPDYMVEKAEKMIRVAPYVAFDMALNELSSTVSTVKDRAENIINALNGLQMDECQSAKAVVMAGKQLFNGQEDQAMETIKSGLVQGADSLFTEAKKAFNDSPGTSFQKAVDKSDNTSDVKADLKRSGYLLDAIGQKMNVSSARLRQFRALVGDVYISTDGTAMTFKEIPGCKEATFENLVKDKPWIKTASTSACSQESGKTILEYVGNNLDSISGKLMTFRSSSMSVSEKEFVSRTPIPVVYILNNASKYGVEQLETVNDALVEPAAYGYAYAMFISMVKNTEDILNDYQLYLNSRDSSVTKVHTEAIEKLIENAEKIRQKAYEAYLVKIGDAEAIYKLLDNFNQDKIRIDKVLADAKIGRW